MGCSCDTRTVDYKNQIEHKIKLNGEDIEIDILYLIYTKLEKFVQINPFYNIKLNIFQNSLNDTKNKENTIEEIMNLFFNDKLSFIKKLFHQVIKDTINKFNFGFNPDSNDLIILIFYFIYIFCTENKAGKRALFQENFKKILKNSNDNKYNRENFFEAIINLVEMHTSFFEYFFLYFAFREVFDNNNKNYNEIFNNDSFINDINTYIDTKLKMINENFSSSFLNYLILSEINNKIQPFIENENNIDNEEMIILDENKINLISDKVYDSLYIKNYIQILFFGDNRNY